MFVKSIKLQYQLIPIILKNYSNFCFKIKKGQLKSFNKTLAIILGIKRFGRKGNLKLIGEGNSFILQGGGLFGTRNWIFGLEVQEKPRFRGSIPKLETIVFGELSPLNKRLMEVYLELCELHIDFMREFMAGRITLRVLKLYYEARKKRYLEESVALAIKKRKQLRNFFTREDEITIFWEIEYGNSFTEKQKEKIKKIFGGTVNPEFFKQRLDMSYFLQFAYDSVKKIAKTYIKTLNRIHRFFKGSTIRVFIRDNKEFVKKIEKMYYLMSLPYLSRNKELQLRKLEFLYPKFSRSSQLLGIEEKEAFDRKLREIKQNEIIKPMLKKNFERIIQKQYKAKYLEKMGVIHVYL